jgi:hypothetical protein
MSEAFYGVNLHWGLGSTTVTVTNAVGVYQSANYSTPADKLETRDQRGIFNAVQYTNAVEKLSLEWLASDANSASGSAALAYPNVSTNCTITSDCQFSGSGWKCDDIQVRETNTANTIIAGQFTRYPRIS